MRKTINFSQESEKTLVPAWKDYVNNYRAVNFSTKKQYDTSKTLEQKETLVNSAIDKEIGRYFNLDCDFVDKEAYVTNPTYQWATFAVVNKLVDMIIPDVVTEDFLNVANTSTIGYGDSVDFEIKSGDLFVVTKNGNSRRHVESQRQYTGMKALVPTNHTITTEVDLYRVLAGKESLAEYAMKVALSIESEIAIDIMAAVKESCPTLTANFKENSFSETAFKKLAARVGAANGGAKAVALGTEIGLGTIMPTNDYLKMGLGEIYSKVGYLPVFKGVPLIAIAQKIDWASVDYEFAIDDSDLYFISPQTQKLAQVVFEGGSLAIADSMFGTANLSQKVSLHKRWAVGIITNAKYGHMKVTV